MNGVMIARCAAARYWSGAPGRSQRTSGRFETENQNNEMATSPAVLLRVYAAAIFLSAALLFAVQPMFTKMVLPRLGGTPSVWSVAMVFFQAVLLAGYAYAHALTRYLPGSARSSCTSS